MADVLAVLAHADRLRIVEILESCGGAPVHVVVARLRRPQAQVSHHLQRMRQVRLLTSERRGQEVWYRIANPHAVTILDCLRKKEAQR